MSQPQTESESAILHSVDDDEMQRNTQQQETEMDVGGLNTESIVENDDLLADLELADIGTDLSDGEIIEALSQEDESAIEVLEQTDAAYAEQTVETQVADGSVTQSASTEKKTRKNKDKSAGVATPKVERDLSALPAEIFVLDGANAISDLNANKTAVIGKRPNQKKIGEKFDNLFISLHAGKKPSVYTMAIFNEVVTKETVTSTDLLTAFKATATRGGAAYSESTARSQIGQMMVLFDVVGIAKREGQTLHYNRNSKVAERLLAL